MHVILAIFSSLSFSILGGRGKDTTMCDDDKSKYEQIRELILNIQTHHNENAGNENITELLWMLNNIQWPMIHTIDLNMDLFQNEFA